MFDFDKNDRLPIDGNEIDLTTAYLVPTRDDRITQIHQVLGCPVLGISAYLH